MIKISCSSFSFWFPDGLPPQLNFQWTGAATSCPSWLCWAPVQTGMWVSLQRTYAPKSVVGSRRWCRTWSLGMQAQTAASHMRWVHKHLRLVHNPAFPLFSPAITFLLTLITACSSLPACMLTLCLRPPFPLHLSVYSHPHWLPLSPFHILPVWNYLCVIAHPIPS